MAARRTERLLNLVIALLHTRSYLTADRIRDLVAGYDEAPTDEAFKRMFERDKEDLRELGIPLETGTNSVFDDEPGYRIAQRDYALPDITLDAKEAAAVGLAARMWSSATMSAAATRAIRKLEAAGVEVVALPEGLQPRVESGDAAFPALAEAVHDARVIRFRYRGAASDEPAERTVEPWGVVWWHGRWYLVGHDRDRDATRVFRVSRIDGAPRATGAKGAVSRPESIDLAAVVAAYDAAAPTSVATLRVRSGRGLGLRRRARSEEPDETGWDLLRIGFRDADGLADEVLPYGGDVVVLDPPEAAEQVVERLRTLLADGVPA